MKEKPTRILATYFIYTCISQASRSNKKETLAVSVGVEPTYLRISSYGLANRCIYHSANSPYC